MLVSFHDVNLSKTDTLCSELVMGKHHEISKQNKTAFTKWCPAENGIKKFEQAEEAVDLALRRMGQKSIALMQCSFPIRIEQTVSLIATQIIYGITQTTHTFIISLI